MRHCTCGQHMGPEAYQCDVCLAEWYAAAVRRAEEVNRTHPVEG